jgi:hypothetical protein
MTGECNATLWRPFANCSRTAGDQPIETVAPEDNDVSAEKPRELWLLLTSWYLIFESFRAREASDAAYGAPQALRKSFPFSYTNLFLTAYS